MIQPNTDTKKTCNSAHSLPELHADRPLIALGFAAVAVLGIAAMISSVSRASVSAEVVDVNTLDTSGGALAANRFSRSPNIPRSAEAIKTAMPSRNQRSLSPGELKQNALRIMRQHTNGAKPVESVVSEPFLSELFNVNAFLLANRINNESKLAELQMQTLIGDVNSSQFAAASGNNNSIEQTKSNANRALGFFAGIGFPHIETNNRPNSERYKPYRQLINLSGNGNEDIVPHVACMGLSPQRVAERAKKYEAQIVELAVRNRVSASLVKAVVTKESCFDEAARSHAGAIGLMQLMPETARWLKVKKPENAAQNLAAGVRYLAQLKKRFGTNELALAAYNAGPGNVDRYKGVPPFAETESYVRDVMHYYRGYVATTRYVNALNDF